MVEGSEGQWIAGYPGPGVRLEFREVEEGGREYRASRSSVYWKVGGAGEAGGLGEVAAEDTTHCYCRLG